uniref:hypothetical protein n=1 Tax=Pseudonocardia sp. CA-138482 TaxID=3240023 RepID=UPI003F493C00
MAHPAGQAPPITEPDFPVGGNREHPIGWRSHPGLLTVEQAAQRLDFTTEQVLDLLRARKLRAIWARRRGRVLYGITEKSLKPHALAADAKRQKLERIFAQQGLLRRCPHCGANIRLLEYRLLAEHNHHGKPCPGGIHGQSRIPIPGDYRTGPRPRDDEAVAEWLDAAGMIPLDDALKMINLPDRVVAELVAAKKIKATWVRWDGQAHPVLDRDDVEAVIAARDKIRKANAPPTTPTWMAANP